MHSKSECPPTASPPVPPGHSTVEHRDRTTALGRHVLGTAQLSQFPGIPWVEGDVIDSGENCCLYMKKIAHICPYAVIES